MATITGFTAERMLAIEDGTVVTGAIVGGNLILTTHDGTEINAGPVVGPPGPPGPQGPSAVSSIPGEVKLWPGSVLPVQATYGKWVWCDGAVYAVATYPIAAGHIAAAWKTAYGQSDPGAGNFRVPDLRGVAPVGLDAMPGGARANRMTRSIAIVLAGKTGEETHVLTLPEAPGHSHGISVGGSSDGAPDHHHTHWEPASPTSIFYVPGSQQVDVVKSNNARNTGEAGAHSHGISVNGSSDSQGGGGGHENTQPTVFVPYIVRLDG